MRQLPLNLSFRAASGRENFLVSACNAEAVRWLDRWPDWPSPVLRLSGAAGSGKSHLLQVWRQASGARVISGAGLPAAVPALLKGGGMPPLAVDDAHGCPDPAALLHLYNRCREDGAFLLLAATPGAWRAVTLADLASRLAAAPEIRLGDPDEEVLAAGFLKQCADRRLNVPPEVLAYILPRLERSFAAVRSLAALLDRESLAARRRVTIPLAAGVLAQAAAGDGGNRSAVDSAGTAG